MGIECKKQEVYVAFAQDGALIDHEPQRLQVPAVHEETARLRGFLVDFGHVLAETKPDAVRIAQPEQVYEAQYTELAPKAALETLRIRLLTSWSRSSKTELSPRPAEAKPAPKSTICPAG